MNGWVILVWDVACAQAAAPPAAESRSGANGGLAAAGAAEPAPSSDRGEGASAKEEAEGGASAPADVASARQEGAVQPEEVRCCPPVRHAVAVQALNPSLLPT